METMWKSGAFLAAILLAAGCASATRPVRTVAGHKEQPTKPTAAQPVVAQPATVQPVNKEPGKPAAAPTTEADKFRRENDALYTKLKSYTEGVITQSQLVSDGWNFKDPFYDRIGVVGLYKNAGKAVIVIGIIPVDRSKLGEDTIQFMFGDTMSQSLAEVLRAENIRHEPANIALVVCVIELSDGVVKKVGFTNRPIPWSEVQH